jgi:GT2 family glycosyltransferase
MSLQEQEPGPPAVERAQDVTVVVMTMNRTEDLRVSLGHHEAAVIVVDNGSSPPLGPVVAQVRPDAVCLRLPRNLGAVARNLGVRRASTTYAAFADDDSWWAPGSLARAVAVLDAHPRLAVLAGRVLVGPEHRLDAVSEAMSRAPFGRDSDLPGPNIAGFLACGVVVRRTAFLAAGGFDPVVFFPGEEERVCLDLLSAGWGLAYVEDVVAHHVPPPSADSSTRQTLLARNAVLTAWMRRPVTVALGRTIAAARSGRDGRAGVRAAVPRMPAALARRRRVPVDLERRLRRLEAVQRAERLGPPRH